MSRQVSPRVPGFARKRRSHFMAHVAVLMLAVALAACGGGGGGGAGSSGGAGGSSSSGSGGSTGSGAPGGSGGDAGGGSTTAFAIVGQPVDQTVVSGQPATFTVSASVPASFQWQRFDGSTWGDIAGATSATFVLASPADADTGSRFRVRVTSSSNAASVLTSSEVQLTVTPAPQPPVVSMAPADLTLTAGQSGTFAVTAGGTSITYQWQRSADGTSFVDVPGAVGPTLALVAVTLADSGVRYRVTVTNAQGSVTSASARLTVNPAPAAPAFTAMPVDASVQAGQPVSFNVAVVGTPTPSLQWQTSRDGNAWSDLAGQQGATLSFASVALPDDGTRLRAVATNASGSVASRSALLSVAPLPVAPTITAQPADVNVGIGAAPAFHGAASGTPTPSYQWQLSADGGATFVNITGATAADYTPAPVAAADNGKLVRLVATNASGSATSRVALLTVRPAPHIQQQPQAQAWRTGLPQPRYDILVNGSGITYRWQMRANDATTWTDIAGATSASVTVTPPAADSVVRAIVTNATGDTATSDAAPLTLIKWTYQSPAPTGDAMHALRWADASTVVGVGDAGTIVRSSDAGLTWSVVAETAADFSLTLDGLDFGSPSVGVAVGAQGLIKRTIDAGQHWSVVRVPDPSAAELTAIVFLDAQTAVAVGKGGTMLRSADAGVSWTPIAASVPVHVNYTSNDFVDIVSRHGVTLAATGSGIVLRSINGGLQWSTYDIGNIETTTIAFSSDTDVVMGGYNGLWSSSDAGLTFAATGPSSFFDADIVFTDATHGIAVPVGNGDAKVTADGGQTWSGVNGWSTIYSGLASAVGSVRVGPGGVAMASGQHGQLRRSVDGGATWTEVSATSVSSEVDFSAVRFGTATTGLAIGRSGYAGQFHIFRTVDGGTHWTSVLDDVLAYGFDRVVYSDANTAWVVNGQGALTSTTDGGLTWHGQSSPDPSAINSGGRLAFASAQTGLFVDRRGVVARTSDGGATWGVLAVAPAFTCLDDVQFASATVALVTDCGGAIFRSADAGQTWTQVAPYLSVGGYGQSMTLGFASASVGVAAGSLGTLERTTDGGLTWQVLGTIASQYSVARVVQFVSATEGYVSNTVSDIRRTTDGGATWVVDDSLRGGGITALASPDGVSVVAVGKGAQVRRRTP